MTTYTACSDCGEDTTGLDRCAHCWVVVDPVTLEPRSSDRIYLPKERRVDQRRVDLRLRRLLDEMHIREIREKALQSVRAA